MFPMRCLRDFGCAAALLAASGAVAQQQSNDQPTRVEVWDLELGTPADRLPDDFTDYACGTNGGPPSIPLNGWRDFRSVIFCWSKSASLICNTLVMTLSVY